MKKKIISYEIFYNLSCNILHLVDHNRIVWEGVRHGNPDRIYLFTMLSLNNFYPESNRGPQYAGLARDPRVLAAEISAEGRLAAAVPVATVPFDYVAWLLSIGARMLFPCTSFYFFFT